VHPPADLVAATRARAAEWLVRQRDSGIWTADNQVALEAWLAESPANEIAYLRLEAAWSKADRLAALRRPVPETSSTLAKPRSFARVALLLAIVSTVGLSGAYFLQAPSKDILTIKTDVG